MKSYRVVLDGVRSFHITEDQLDYYKSKEDCVIYEVTETPIYNNTKRGSSDLKTSTSVKIGSNNETK